MMPAFLIRSRRMLLIILLFSFQILVWKGFAATTDITPENRLTIAVPSAPFSEKLVRVTSDDKGFDGFCIRVFDAAAKFLNLNRTTDYEFVKFNGSYDDLVASVASKTYDAAIGDITILADRWRLVAFTEPFTESGLSMVVPVKPAEGWIFLKPFTGQLWLATGGILVYTMFVVWYLEHRCNPEFGGKWKDQLGNVLWFTFTSLFFAYREKISSSLARVVVVVWLFLVLILTQSYTASLTSMLTVTRLNPNIESLRTENAKVGVVRNAFMEKFVENELGYLTKSILPIKDDRELLKAFKNGSISAAFLEIPYAKLFVNTHCHKFTITGSSYKFGGLGFAFQNSSTIANNVSEAILQLSENGTLYELEDSWSISSTKCSDSQADKNTDSLSFESFWGLYLFSVAISTVSLIMFVARLLKNYGRHQNLRVGDIDESENETNIWNNMVRVVKYLKTAELESPRTPQSSSKVIPEIEMIEGPDYIFLNVGQREENKVVSNSN